MLCLMGWALCLMAGAWVWHGSVCGWRACGGVAAVVATGVAARGRCWVMRPQDGWTAVMAAAFNGHESTAGLLLDRGADVEARNKVSGGVDPWQRRRSGVAASRRPPRGGLCAYGWW